MTRTLAAIAALLMVSAFARADVILDDFTSPTPGVEFAISNTNTSPYTITTDLGGGTIRTATFTVTSPNPAGSFSLVGVVGGGSVDMFFNSTSSGNAVINHVFGTPLDLQGIGGSAGAIRLTTQSIGNPDVAYTLDVITATGTLSASGSFANSTVFVDRDVAFTSLNSSIPGGTGDLSQVTGLKLTVTGNTADDFRLDKIAVTEPQQVPAPAGVFLALAALPVLGFRRYFAKKA